MPAAVIRDPRTPHANRRQRALAELAVLVTTEPWTLSRAHHAHAHEAGLSDDDILHAIVLSSYFGHLNRIADAVAVPLDYVVQLPVPATDPTVPPLAPSPIAVTGRPAIELSRRPATAQAIAAWRTYMFDRDAPLTRRQRAEVRFYPGIAQRARGDEAAARARFAEALEIDASFHPAMLAMQ